MKKGFFISVVMAIFSLTLFTQCSDEEKDKDFTIDDLIGSYDFNNTTTTVSTFNGDTTDVSANNYLVTINKTSSTHTLQSNQLIARGLNGGTYEFVLEITDDVFIIVNGPGSGTQHSSCKCNFSE